MGRKKTAVCVLAVLLAIPVLLAGFFELSCATAKKSEIFAIKRGENIFTIAGNLKARRYIGSKVFFVARAAATNNLRSFKAGEYDLAGLDENRIIEKLVSGQVVPLKVAVIPGWSLKETAAEFEGKNIASQAGSLAYLSFDGEDGKKNSRDLERRYDFLQNLPEGASLEGYLYPDTYHVAAASGISGAVTLMLDNFGKNLTPVLKDDIKKQEKTAFEMVTMASMLEKEVRTMEDKKIVAGILWKREERGMPLGVDSTLLYFKAGGQPGVVDKTLDSPYNTYKYAGLPKGPICNPSAKSIEAAVHPTASEYWYYLSARDGTTIFSKTYGEHLANKAKYLGD